MSREELLLKTKDEVVKIAKSAGISQYQGKGRKTKEQLVEEILQLKAEQKPEVPVEQLADEDEDWQNPNVEAAETTTTETEEVKKEVVVDNAEREARRKSYIENVKVGTLVAFKSLTGKIKSAKVVKRSSKNRKLKVETKYGAEFVISYDDVIWVRTNKRWPKGVYQLLKGVASNEESKG